MAWFLLWANMEVIIMSHTQEPGPSSFLFPKTHPSYLGYIGSENSSSVTTTGYFSFLPCLWSVPLLLFGTIAGGRFTTRARTRSLRFQVYIDLNTHVFTFASVLSSYCIASETSARVLSVCSLANGLFFHIGYFSYFSCNFRSHFT